MNLNSIQQQATAFLQSATNATAWKESYNNLAPLSSYISKDLTVANATSFAQSHKVELAVGAAVLAITTLAISYATSSKAPAKEATL